MARSIKQLKLQEQDTSNMKVTRFGIEDYTLGEAQKALVKNVLNEMDKTEFWDPRFQAWYNYLTTYLCSGAALDLNKQYLGDLRRKKDFIFPVSDCTKQPFFDEIIKFYTRVDPTVFSGYNYSELLQFQQFVCKTFLQKNKWITKNIYTADTYNETLTELVKSKSFNNLMLALYMYRHVRVARSQINPEVSKMFNDRIMQWIADFTDEFEKVASFSDDKREQYPWYCEEILKILQEAWRAGLNDRYDTPYMSKDDLIGLPAEVTTQLINYTALLPCTYNNVWTTQQAFSIYYTFLFENPSICEDFSKKCILAAAVPQKIFSKVVKYMYRFYWDVQYGKITTVIAHKNDSLISIGSAAQGSTEQLIDNLMLLGFPPKLAEDVDDFVNEDDEEASD